VGAKHSLPADNLAPPALWPDGRGKEKCHSVVSDLPNQDAFWHVIQSLHDPFGIMDRPEFPKVAASKPGGSRVDNPGAIAHLEM
jgi:hypothetical protein